jgi:demethylmenaquinone methyltransferase/2-methoxy-6-polyprenyl-1,4-benzoquinol methylase
MKPLSEIRSNTERERMVETLFDTISHRYDLINSLQSFGLHKRWKRCVAEMAGVAEGSVAADICCGTGDIAFQLARRGSRVIAVDFSAGMLRVAQKRSREGKASFTRASAYQLPLRDSEIDAVTIGFGLRNLHEPERGLEEFARILKRGGRLVILDAAKPKSPILRTLFSFYFGKVVPLMGVIFFGDRMLYQYLPDSLESYLSREALAVLMTKCGFERVRCCELGLGTATIHIGYKE